MRNFATCHCHPQSLDSASTPEAFAKREVELGTGVITVTDHGSLAACRTVFDLAKKNKLTPVLGLEGYFRDDNCEILQKCGIPKNDKGTYADYFKYAHFTVHFLDQAAYNCGVKLLSNAPIERHGQETKPLFNWNDLEELAAHNVTMTTGCLIGMVQRHLLDNNDPQMAIRYFEKMQSIVGRDRLFVEVFPHICDRNWVKGVFVTVNEGDKQTRLKFHDGKKLKTNVGEITAEDLAKAWAKKGNKHEILNAVKDYQTWNERNPVKILDVQRLEDFLPNECRPWAPDGDVQRGCNEFVIEMATKYKAPILIADDSHFAKPDEKPVQDVRLMASGGSWRFYGSYHRQSSEEAYAYFKNKLGTPLAQFEEWVDNSYGWAERFKNFKFETKPSLPTKFYPQDTLRHTLDLIKKHGRMDWSNKQYVKRLETEIELLHKNGTIDLLPYFFVDEEVCWLYTQNGLLTGPGRGSAAGLLLTYLLGITHADPLRYNLSLERFITKDRIASGALPDIDQDLPNRDLLVAPEVGFLHKRFGDHFAQISVDTTLKLKSAIKDVCRVLVGRVTPEIEALTRKLPDPPQGVSDYNFVFGYTDSGNWHPGIIESDPVLQDYAVTYPEQWDIVKRALGLARQKSRHACGFVIANESIPDLGIPLTTISETTCTAFTPASVEAMGGVKMDFLVINSLNDLAAAIRLIQERHGVAPAEGMKINGKWVPQARLVPHPTMTLSTPEGHGPSFVDIWDLPEDQKVFKDISLGKTETVFQFNTPGAVQLLRNFAYRKGADRWAIDSVEAMSAFTALDRPGPLDAMVKNPEDDSEHNMLVEYARRARGATPSPDIFPFLDKLFPETYGIMVYQEQLQQAYQYLTGCTGPEAEEFRRNIAKKKMEKVLAAYPNFIEKASIKLGSKDDAEKAWGFFKTFGQYGFNKSHSVCYSIIGYACAYLKHHYPLEWWTAVLRNATKEEINEKFWRYCGHLIDLPDVTKSRDTFEIVNERIQAPLSLLHGVGEKAHQQLVAGRPYANIDDFCNRIQQFKEAGATYTKKTERKEKKNRKTGEVTVEEKEVIKKKLATSALNRGICYTLLISGAMDSLFPPDYASLDMLQAYEESLARATGKKKVEPVKPEYVNVHQLTRYQMRKQILPAYSAKLLPMFEERGIEGVYKDGKRYGYKWKEFVPFASVSDLERINAISPFPDNPLKVAVAAYVENVRRFNYGDGKAKEAVDYTLDVDGGRMKFVKWGRREDGKLSEKFKTDYTGCIIIAILSKYKEGKPFTLEDIIVVQEPLGLGSEQSPEPEESK
jgi:DNA-directed DNA polymerase III PolC